ncbi:MAG: DUF2007 domain-containing protein [Betaproteobacteria bacterium]|jgi:hypothetical protein
MKKLFVAANVMEAKLVAQLLEENGIGAMIFNESLQGGVGEIPFVESWPEVRVRFESDWQRAKDLLESFLNPSKVSDWECDSCSETNPGNFESCWRCGSWVKSS